MFFLVTNVHFIRNLKSILANSNFKLVVTDGNSHRKPVEYLTLHLFFKSEAKVNAYFSILINVLSAANIDLVRKRERILRTPIFFS